MFTASWAATLRPTEKWTFQYRWGNLHIFLALKNGTANVDQPE
jgi:hypothetical protein